MVYIFSVEGNIGSGKSTLVRMLKDTYNAKNDDILFLEEPVKIWETITDNEGESILSKFYANQTKYAFSFQMMAYISRISMLKQAIKDNPNKIIICERCVMTDKNVFAKMLYDSGNIEDVEYQIYLRWFDEFIEDVPLTGIVYVKAEPSISHSRVLKRKREGETIPLEYLESCHNYHERWINKSDVDVLILDANEDKDYNSDSYEDWVCMIKKFITYRTRDNFNRCKEAKMDMNTIMNITCY